MIWYQPSCSECKKDFNTRILVPFIPSHENGNLLPCLCLECYANVEIREQWEIPW